MWSSSSSSPRSLKHHNFSTDIIVIDSLVSQISRWVIDWKMMYNESSFFHYFLTCWHCHCFHTTSCSNTLDCSIIIFDEHNIFVIIIIVVPIAMSYSTWSSLPSLRHCRSIIIFIGTHHHQSSSTPPSLSSHHHSSDDNTTVDVHRLSLQRSSPYHCWTSDHNRWVAFVRLITVLFSIPLHLTKRHHCFYHFSIFRNTINT